MYVSVYPSSWTGVTPAIHYWRVLAVALKHRFRFCGCCLVTMVFPKLVGSTADRKWFNEAEKAYQFVLARQLLVGDVGPLIVCEMMVCRPWPIPLRRRGVEGDPWFCFALLCISSCLQWKRRRYCRGDAAELSTYRMQDGTAFSTAFHGLYTINRARNARSCFSDYSQVLKRLLAWTLLSLEPSRNMQPSYLWCFRVEFYLSEFTPQLTTSFNPSRTAPPLLGEKSLANRVTLSGKTGCGSKRVKANFAGLVLGCCVQEPLQAAKAVMRVSQWPAWSSPYIKSNRLQACHRKSQHPSWHDMALGIMVSSG